MKMKWMGIALAAALLPMGISAAQADTVTPFGDTIGTGPWTLTSTAITYSGLEVDPAASFTFGQLTSLSATFTDITGGAYGGSPRLSVGLDNGGAVSYIHIALGTSPNYNDIFFIACCAKAGAAAATAAMPNPIPVKKCRLLCI